MKDIMLEEYIDLLLTAALRKCGSLEDARDLTQDTLLAALPHIRGGTVENPRGWLLTVLNRKFYDMLRRKYKYPTVTISEVPEDLLRCEDDIPVQDEEERSVRREVAYLSEIYRTIITRRYFRGESVDRIAAEMGIPAGTVKSRLSFARNEIRKGLEKVESYEENSYIPQILYVRNSGGCGLDDEPMSLVPDDDRLTQNLLILAYEKPVTVSELARGIGIPTAYIERTVQKLVDGELMKRLGDGRVYTDFVIYDPEDHYKYIGEQEKFARDNADSFCIPLKRAISALKSRDYYSERLERFMSIEIAAGGTWDSLAPHIKPQIFPDRPNGGSWIAFGNKWPENYIIPEDKRGKEEYGMAGRRHEHISEFMGFHDIEMYNYETSLYPHHLKFGGFGYSIFGEMEADMLKLFCLINKGIDPESVGFTPKMLKNIPKMVRNGMLEMADGKPRLLIPCLTHAQSGEYSRICREAVSEAAASLTSPMGEYIKNKRKKIPPHLKSVPDQKLLMPYTPSSMIFVFEAINRGVIKRDLGYPCPETIVVMD